MAKRYVTRKACAEALGISRQRVEQLIKRGDFKETKAGIDLAAAKRKHAKLKQLDKSVVANVKPAPVPMAHDHPAAGDDGQDVFDFSEARAKKENWNAKLAEANYKKLIGTLVSRDEVSAKEFAVARKLRDRILQFPSKLAHFMPPEAMSLLTEECDQLVRDLQEDATAIAETSQVA